MEICNQLVAQRTAHIFTELFGCAIPFSYGCMDELFIKLTSAVGISHIELCKLVNELLLLN